MSPLASNIYLDQLDSYINRLKRIVAANKGKKSKTNSNYNSNANQKWKTIRNKME